jgi:hypothetical protein
LVGFSPLTVVLMNRLTGFITFTESVPSPLGEPGSDGLLRRRTLLPSSAGPYPQLDWVSSEGYYDAVRQSAPFVVTIRHAPASSPVHAAVTVSVNGETRNAGCGLYTGPNAMPPESGRCLVGHTDSTGHFAFGGNYSGVAPGDYRELWSAGPAFIGDNAYTIVADGAALPEGRPVIVRLPDGSIEKYGRANRIEVSRPTSSYHPIGGGKFQYDFVLDTREAEIIRVGDDFRYSNILKEGDLHPNFQNGWFSTGTGWISLPSQKPLREKGLKFTLVSDWLPGPVAVMFLGKDQPVSQPVSMDWISRMSVRDQPMINIILAGATGINRDSVRKVVIGPAIRPGYTSAGLVRVIRSWVQTLCLGFLIPMTKEGVDLKQTLETLQTSNDLERSIVECLRVVL